MSNVFEPFTSGANGPVLEPPATEPKRKRGRPRKAAAPRTTSPRVRRQPAPATAAPSAPTPTPQAPRKARKVAAGGVTELEERMIAELARRPAVARSNLLKKLNRIFA